VANTMAYFDTTTNTTVKCFTVQAPGVDPIKKFENILFTLFVS
jgi:hypothetical protein